MIYRDFVIFFYELVRVGFNFIILIKIRLVCLIYLFSGLDWIKGFIFEYERS